MATHSSILAWKIPWTEEPGGPQSMSPQTLDTTEQLNTHTKQEKASEKIFEEIIVENFPNEGKEISSGSTESHSE